MIKLKDAKCPNCGANIQVNDKLENTICQYCGSQVVIEEAIEKYKLEISGKVEVEGIKGRTSKINQARKHFKLEEYNEAETILRELIQEDSFDTEAYIELLKIDIIKIENSNFNESTSDVTDPKNWKLLKEIGSYYDRIKKIDDNNIADAELSEYIDKINYYNDFVKNTKEDEKKLQKLVEKLNGYLAKVEKISNSCADVWVKDILNKKFLNCGLVTRYQAVDGNGSDFTDEYHLMKYSKITRDGILFGNYYKATTNFTTNPRNVELYNTVCHKMSSIDEIEQSMDEVFSITEEYINKSTNIRNKEIEKENKKIDTQNTVTSVKNKFKYVIIAVLALWILLMGSWTLSLFIEGHIGGAIAAIIFLDSWLIGYPFIKIKDMLSDIKYDKDMINRRKNNKQDKI